MMVPEIKMSWNGDKQASVLKVSRKFFDDLSHVTTARQKGGVNKTEAIIEAVYGPHWHRKLIRSALDSPASSDEEEAQRRQKGALNDVGSIFLKSSSSEGEEESDDESLVREPSHRNPTESHQSLSKVDSSWNYLSKLQDKSKQDVYEIRREGSKLNVHELPDDSQVLSNRVRFIGGLNKNLSKASLNKKSFHFEHRIGD